MLEPKPCIYCGAESVALCDAVLGYPFLANSESVVFTTKRGSQYVDGRSREVRTIDTGKAAFTCDVPMCAKCTNPVSLEFYCGKEGGVDFTDLCKEHRTEHPWGVDIPLITPQAAAHKRSKVHARARERGKTIRLRLVSSHA